MLSFTLCLTFPSSQLLIRLKPADSYLKKLLADTEQVIFLYISNELHIDKNVLEFFKYHFTFDVDNLILTLVK